MHCNRNTASIGADPIQVTVNGVTYDVTFSNDASCTTVFSPCDSASVFTFTNPSDAAEAFMQIDIHVGLTGTALGHPFAAHLPSHGSELMLIPYSADESFVFVLLSVYSGDSGLFPLGPSQGDVSQGGPNFHYVIFNKVTSVPEPGTLILLGLGLLGLLGLRKRRKAQINM